MADYSEEERAQLASEGNALPDGSFPIKTCDDAENARHDYGRAPESHRAAVVSLINKREAELHCGREPFKPGSE